jgi:hypothetical protein
MDVEDSLPHKVPAHNLIGKRAFQEMCISPGPDFHLGKVLSRLER